jgi:RNA polymerase sigma-70 factor, ECF subfamily
MSEWQNIDEAQLLKKAREGDTSAFEQLYEHYAPGVFRFLFSHLDNRLDAEDLTEEVFLRVWRSLGGFRQQGVPFSSFVLRVARNALIDHYRRSRRRPPEQEIVDELIDDAQHDPAQTLHARLEHKEVRQMLEQLHEDYRRVLDLRFLADLSPDETAQVMGKSPGAIRVLQHRALAALRQLMAKQK